ncbi:MAG: exodeoxyribonuclease VII large subunit [Tissierellia bacterium]|nr:exodeoxyribonuclease VII large subunit [Tissierellia bacterium]
MELKPLKVSEVNNYIKRILLSDMVLSNISVEGEISNFKHHYSGHMYFSLKDDRGKIKAVMFKGDNERLNFKLEDGMKIIATGYISVYEREGEYQLYVKDIKASGIGELYKAFEELKNRLEKEGLFSQENKKQIPSMPRKIGVVTSSTGAAIRDIITIIKRRFPPCNILIYPTLVQGINAPEEICKGLEYLDSRDDIDLIITGRGGGSIEELFAFNSEKLARTIYKLKTPVISAVGHETDFTIADFVADLRAPTPSAAAELAVPDITYLLKELQNKYDELKNIMHKKIRDYKLELENFDTKLNLFSPLNQLKDKKIEIDNIFKDLNYIMEKKLSEKKAELQELKGKLELLNPNMAIDRGYGIIVDNRDNLVKSIDNINLGDKIGIILKDGKILSIVDNIEKGEKIDEFSL